MQCAVFLSFALITALSAQDPVGPFVDEVKVNAAIQKGVEYLRTAKSPGGHLKTNCDELLLWTFIHAGVPEQDPKFSELLASVLGAPLERTYKVALLAMCLEEIDRVKYQEKIAQCAQFLVDNQCPNGQWSYGNPSEYVNNVTVPAPPKNVASGQARTAKTPTGKPKVTRHVALRKMKEGPPTGDNSNSQYAALGLRACFESGVDIPESIVQLAIKWWRESQFEDPKKGEKKPAVATGPTVSGRMIGWNYQWRAVDARAPYHAMTAGGIGSLVIYDYMLGRRWQDDSHVKEGLNWLAAHFEIAPSNPYYMYGLERAGILYGTEKIGEHFWYSEGAKAILAAQSEDGSWGKDTEWDNMTWDTCFSMLFLRRATRPLVATESAGKLKK